MVEITKIKLDKTDRKILAELDKNCRIPSTRLAKIVMKSRQAVEYRINQLVKKGIITSFNAAFNPHKIGYKLYKIYLKLRNIPQEKKKLFTFLKSSGLVYWMGEFSGSWDLIFGVFCKNDHGFYEMKNELLSKFSKIIVEEAGDILVDVKQYSKMYFTNEIVSPVMFAGEIVNNELDELDFSILGNIVNDARIPINELAKKVNTTPTIVRGKLKRLEQKGIIIQYRIGINLNKLGLELYKAIIKLDRYTKEDELKLLEYISRLPNVHYFIRNIWQLEPELVVGSYQEYYEIIENLKKEFPYVIRTIDSVLMITDEWTPGFKNMLELDNNKKIKT
ncbi:winged helix-turn-helix transcriptional regulator [Candidatus Woesearchaeota archaeon]|jgi:Lrp/AsnC family transcriptional regulator, leucine-responsive regulatory protein|nr:winged helix-turn-helix transcriptional regulator [Candidatus Woesearchaeota archaeon]MBT5272316.1 winged helix-turn-helix transcriptional regulator [Candidatus Woesearchaeota archaeon]MBT6040645.1 winged helix-turn-helix transcriptional regulator [Candidatus Woesearchaeota archaeon]MBT6336588.1 winged helix-turn-helix transcriptional regulator [Candidatus Woesearchaeota archaeon]MBT7927478.1 winged helix-turn-helix transcriptional regulator [Candidatus Woesearchaeota archaeon]